MVHRVICCESLTQCSNTLAAPVCFLHHQALWFKDPHLIGQAGNLCSFQTAPQATMPYSQTFRNYLKRWNQVHTASCQSHPPRVKHACGTCAAPAQCPGASGQLTSPAHHAPASSSAPQRDCLKLTSH